MFLTAGDGSLINLHHVAKIEINERAEDGGGTRGEWVAYGPTGGALGRRGDYASVNEARDYVREVTG